MASYFDEHDCEPEESPELITRRMNFILMLRSMLQRNEEIETREFEQFLPHGERLAPPASISVVNELPRHFIRDLGNKENQKCSVCLALFESDVDMIVEMPCKHFFHSSCLLPWLKKTNSCPLCRLELKTDDPSYEAYKLEKIKENEREQRVETLHNSMFG